MPTFSADRLRAAIIGCGNIAGGYDRVSAPDEVQTHVKAYQLHPRTQIVAVSDVIAEKAEAFAHEWHVPRAYADVAEMLRVERPEIVSICTPDDTHAALIQLCLVAAPPRAIWCEKPIDVDEAAAQEAVERCERADVLLAVNYMRRWDSQMQRVGRAIRSGEIGAVRKAIFTYSNGVRHAGSHGLSLLLDWLGQPIESEVYSAMADRAGDDRTIDARLRCANGADLILIGLDERRYSQWEIDLFAERARVRITHFGAEVQWQHTRPVPGAPNIQALSPDVEVAQTDLPHIMRRVLDDIVAALDEGRQPICNGRSALRTLQVCNALIAKSRLFDHE
jgi:predicted dehydrogenase